MLATKPKLETKSKFILALEDYKEKYFMNTPDQYGTASQQPPTKEPQHPPAHTPPPPTHPHDPNKTPEHEDEHDKEEKK